MNQNWDFNMELNVLGSGSKGNCYLINNNNEGLVIEAGVNLQAVQKLINFNLKIINGL